MQQKDIVSVKRAVDANLGRKVRVRANRGRHKYSITDGVLFGCYPSIFTVKVKADEGVPDRLVSFSYIDILTHDVQLVLCKQQ